MLSWSAGWYHEPGKTYFKAAWAKGKRGIDPDAYTAMLLALWKLLDEADFVVGWNSDRFDLGCGVLRSRRMPPFQEAAGI